MENELKIYLRNDAIFKYILSRSDSDSIFLRNIIFEGVLKRKLHNVIILNPDIDKNSINGKSIRLDILAEDEFGKKINIEMR